MLRAYRHRKKDEHGFTLIELMVVVLIIAILIAVAIPTFMGAQDRARDRSAQAGLRNAFTAAKSIATDFEGAWRTGPRTAPVCTSAAFATALESENASLTYVAGTAALETGISVEVASSSGAACDQLLLQRQSTSGKHFCLAADKSGNTFRMVSTAGIAFADFAACDDVENGW
ncbi:MAG TPA: prepilin-type N-terminal cleavage/methylation domain-containing protein [Acidimicrobiales bacterium]|nr:prepilin-type N-terminal cleavage/methylation domain-containing protein [Acidimicrobiales bacterium]